MGIRVLLFSASIVIFLFGCDIVDDSPCGPQKTYDLYVLGDEIVDTSGAVFSSYMQSNNRVFQWSKLIDDVCTDEHVKSNFKVALVDETSAQLFKARGVVSWQFLYEKTYDAKLEGNYLKASGETGLKEAFPDLHGWIVPALEVYFPTKGSFELDTAFLKKHVVSVEIESVYREYK